MSLIDLLECVNEYLEVIKWILCVGYEFIRRRLVVEEWWGRVWVVEYGCLFFKLRDMNKRRKYLKNKENVENMGDGGC